MNLKDALAVLKEEGIATHIETVRRWVRKGDIKATINGKYRQGGYEVDEKDLQEFILKKKAENNQTNSSSETDQNMYMLKTLLKKYMKENMGQVMMELVKESKAEDFEDVLNLFETKEFEKKMDIRDKQVNDFLFSLDNDQLRKLYEMEVKIK